LNFLNVHCFLKNSKTPPPRDDREKVESANYEELNPTQLLELWANRRKIGKKEGKALLKKAEETIDQMNFSKKGGGGAHGGFSPKKIRLVNFRSHAETEFDFTTNSFTVICGFNSSRSSSVV